MKKSKRSRISTPIGETAEPDSALGGLIRCAPVAPRRLAETASGWRVRVLPLGSGERSAAPALGGHGDRRAGGAVALRAGADRRRLAARRLAGGRGDGPGPARGAAADGAERGAARAAPPAAGAGPGRARAGRGRAGAAIDSVQMAAAALERLDREINGEAAVAVPGAAAGAAAARVGGRRAGGRGRRSPAARCELRWRAGEATIAADRGELAQALDNLIVNAIEHGGPRVVVAAPSAARAGCASRSPTPAAARGRRSRRREPGRADRPARRPAGATATGCGSCGGSPPPTAASFRAAPLGRGGTEATLELPLAGGRWQPREPPRPGARLRARGPARRRRRRRDRRRLRRQRRPRLRRAAPGASSPAPTLAAGRAIDPGRAAEALEVRRVPARFVPPGALRGAGRGGRPGPGGGGPGRRLPARLAAAPAARRERPARSASAAAAARSRSRSAAPTRCWSPAAQPVGARVDVVVTDRTDGAAAGPHLRRRRRRCRCWRSGPGADGAGPGGTAAATLGLTRAQALRLIAAESFARQVTLLPRG